MNLVSNSRTSAAMFVVALALLFHWSPARAQTAQGGASSIAPPCNFPVSGDISDATLAYLRYRFDALPKSNAKVEKRCFVSFDSLGGDVESAIRIGQFLRAKRTVTIVPANAKCASACVLAFLGGVGRFAFGRIGIHRPYSSGLSASVDQSEASYSRVNALVKSYFIEMNIPLDLLTAMNGIPPDQVMWLSTTETARFHITGKDPAWADYQDSQAAQALGISKETLYERRNLAKQLCANEHDPAQEVACYFKVVRDGVR